MLIQQPSGSIKLTNVSLVRMRKGKKRFEIACYQNKVVDWRKGVEKDLDEVLQIPQVFLNVSKGQVANNDELKAAFGTTNQDEIILQILKKGELQVGNKERQAKADQAKAEVLHIIADKCINPTNKRPYPASIIEKTLHELSFNVNANKPPKTQALEGIKLLVSKQVIPIARARMKVRVTAPSKDAKKYSDKVKALAVEVDDEDWSEEWELIAFIDPGSFKQLDELVRNEGKGKANVELLETAVIQEGDQAL
ncbi:ribosome maturation protein Sdo1p [Trichomonascus vanleenenianus]|uniref:guanine nucleotide exchange factor SDO1 n=1 Tax=Trichomonascus vanleenenianus TaxID=2268995 RepID=UPI003ECAC7F4